MTIVVKQMKVPIIQNLVSFKVYSNNLMIIEICSHKWSNILQIIYFCISVLVYAGAQPIYDHENDHEQLPAESHSHAYGGDFGGYGGHGSHVYQNPNTGVELANLAQNSAAQANQAVLNQASAGSQAAYGIKSSLATAAAEVS